MTDQTLTRASSTQTQNGPPGRSYNPHPCPLPMNDFRYALRQLLKQTGFTILAVVARALGIGANKVLFTAINPLSLRPLSYPQPEQLVRLWGSFPERGLDRANIS